MEKPVIVFVSLALTEDKRENKKFKKRNADLVGLRSGRYKLKRNPLGTG